MTFYNIIFAILFYGATRELLRAFSVLNWTTVVMAGTLTLLVFNDTLYTPHSIESQGSKYKLSMKLVDLLIFLILSVSLITVSPSDNIFGSNPSFLSANLLWLPTIFWGLITVYWFLAMIWNRLSETPGAWITYCLWIPSFVMCLGTAIFPCSIFILNGGLVVLGLLILYLFIYKPIAYGKLGG